MLPKVHQIMMNDMLHVPILYYQFIIIYLILLNRPSQRFN